MVTPWKKVGDPSPGPIDPQLLRYTVHCAIALGRADFTAEVAAGFVARADAVAWVEDRIARDDPDPKAPRIWYVVNQATSTIVERIETDEHGAPRRTPVASTPVRAATGPTGKAPSPRQRRRSEKRR